MPSRLIVPESGSCSVAIVRMRELFPAPFGPTRPNMLFPIESERFFSAFTPFGYVLDRPLIERATLPPFSRIRLGPTPSATGGNGELFYYQFEKLYLDAVRSARAKGSVIAR